MELGEQVKKMMQRIRVTSLPSPDAIVRETFQRLSLMEGQVEPEAIRDHFETHLRRAYSTCLEVLEEHEQEAYTGGIPEGIASMRHADVRDAEEVARKLGFKEGFIHLVGKCYPVFRLAFQSVSQSRMARGGIDFELQIQNLLRLARIPFEPQAKVLKADIVFPSERFLSSNPNRGAMATLKRTLRERWREVVEEMHALRYPNMFLLTADENISEKKAETIIGNRVYLVVWKEVKEKLDNPNMVLSFNDWLKDHILDLARHWKV